MVREENSAPTGNLLQLEVSWTVRFLWAKRFTSTKIHRDISTVYGPHAVLCPAIVKWYQQIKDGRTDLTNAEREGRLTKMSIPNITVPT